jgi:metal-responsive CopG/Arc/MetJ family transcriptional regulator
MTLYTHWDMTETTQFSMRIEQELLRKIDTEANKEYKNRTELIKEAVLQYLSHKGEKVHLKRTASELWLKGELSDSQLKKALSEEEVKDLTFGKQWIEATIDEIRR